MESWIDGSSGIANPGIRWSPDADGVLLVVASIRRGPALFARSGLVSAEDTNRAARFAREADRKQFLAARALSRRVLAELLACDPAALGFTTGAFGKPALASPAGASPPLSFNISHAGDLVMIGVCREREIGVDLEPIVAGPALEALTRLLPSAPGEPAATEEPATRATRLTAEWTRNEAALKALGTGLRRDVWRLPMSPTDDAGVWRATLTDEPPERREMTIQEVDVAPGHSAAVALLGVTIPFSVTIARLAPVGTGEDSA